MEQQCSISIRLSYDDTTLHRMMMMTTTVATATTVAATMLLLFYFAIWVPVPQPNFNTGDILHFGLLYTVAQND